MYYLTFDGDDKTPVGESLTAAHDAFLEAVEQNAWVPALEDDEGIVLVSWDNSNSYYEPANYDLLIGPMEDPNPEPGVDRIAEEHEYRFGDWRL